MDVKPKKYFFFKSSQSVRHPGWGGQNKYVGLDPDYPYSIHPSSIYCPYTDQTSSTHPFNICHHHHPHLIHLSIHPSIHPKKKLIRVFVKLNSLHDKVLPGDLWSKTTVFKIKLDNMMRTWFSRWNVSSVLWLDVTYLLGKWP